MNTKEMLKELLGDDYLPETIDSITNKKFGKCNFYTLGKELNKIENFLEKYPNEKQHTDIIIFKNTIKSLIKKASTNYWFFYEHSLGLKRAAFALWPAYEKIFKDGLAVTEEYVLLQWFLHTLAVAIENLIKSRIIWKFKKDGQPHVDSINDIFVEFRKPYNNETKKDIRNLHDIIRLIDKYSISITPEEHELIKRLAPYTDWAGRFALPFNDCKLFEVSKNPVLGRICEEIDFPIINNLFDKIAKEISN
jgi:hypothetical protein